MMHLDACPDSLEHLHFFGMVWLYVTSMHASIVSWSYYHRGGFKFEEIQYCTVLQYVMKELLSNIPLRTSINYQIKYAHQHPTNNGICYITSEHYRY